MEIIWHVAPRSRRDGLIVGGHRPVVLSR
jgi:hypothetical protein